MMLAADLPPPAIIECQPHKPHGAREYWSWREVDGRPCWYAGRPGKPKHELHWSRDYDVVRPGADDPDRLRRGYPPDNHPPPMIPRPRPWLFEDRWPQCKLLVTGASDCR
jgi:hypothetical protein